jgi:transposase
MRETSADRSNEMLTMNEVCGKWRCEAFKLPHFHSLDHALIRGRKVFALCEVKVRSSSWRKYQRVMIGLEKVLTARQIGRNSGLKTFLIVRWTDGVGFISFECDFDVEIGGRTDRGTDETNLVAMFDINDFTFIRDGDDGRKAAQSSNFAGS